MLTEEQTERVRYVLLSHNVMQEEVENFPLRIGGTVPPNVPLTQLPIEIADVVPAYARYSYVIVQNRIVIAVSNSRRIEVAIPF